MGILIPGAGVVGSDETMLIPGAGVSAGDIPPQVSGLRTFYGATVQELSLVVEADAPAGMGGVLKIDKNGTKVAAYLVETTDEQASNVRIQTSTGTKAIRLKT